MVSPEPHSGRVTIKTMDDELVPTELRVYGSEGEGREQAHFF